MIVQGSATVQVLRFEAVLIVCEESDDGRKSRAERLETPFVVVQHRVDHLIHDPHEESNYRLHYGDMTDATNLIRLLQAIQRPRSTISLRRAMCR
jgi:hypothetical protein